MDKVAIEEVKAIAAGMVGGAAYGIKIRLPHALAMTLAFRNDLTARQKLQVILRLTWEHSSRLAVFAALYKALLAAFKLAMTQLENHHRHHNQKGSYMTRSFRRILSFLLEGSFTKGHRLVPRLPGYPSRNHHALIAGAVAGYVVWGTPSSVNYQVVLYLTSRIIVGLARRFIKNRQRWHSLTRNSSFPFYSAVVWGIVMLLFEESPEVLQLSLRRSMDEIYRSNILDQFSV